MTFTCTAEDSTQLQGNAGVGLVAQLAVTSTTPPVHVPSTECMHPKRSVAPGASVARDANLSRLRAAPAAAPAF